jgi:hypothetical protein
MPENFYDIEAQTGVNANNFYASTKIMACTAVQITDLTGRWFKLFPDLVVLQSDILLQIPPQ